MLQLILVSVVRLAILVAVTWAAAAYGQSCNDPAAKTTVAANSQQQVAVPSLVVSSSGAL